MKIICEGFNSEKKQNIILKKNKIIFVVAAFFLLNIFCVNAQNEKTDDLAKIYGYYKGQEFTIAKLKEEYPDYYKRIEIARLNWDIRFKPVVEYSVSSFKEFFGNNYKDFQFTLDSTFNKQMVGYYNSKVELDIEEMVKELENRGKGILESPFLELFLKYHPLYTKYPQKEFADNYKQVFETNGEGKSKGLKIRFSVPLSWEKLDGIRPNIVAKYSINRNDETCSLVCSIQDVTTIPDMSQFLINGVTFESIMKEDLNQEYADELATSMGSKSTANGFKKITIDKHPAIQFNSEFNLERAGTMISGKYYNSLILYENYIINISMYVSPSTTGEKQIQTALAQEQLFSFILNSFVILSQYSNHQKEYRIRLTDNLGVYNASIEVGGEKYDYIIDTGASLFSITEEIEAELLKKGTIKSGDYLDDIYMEMADGSMVKTKLVILPSVYINDVHGVRLEAKNIQTAIVPKGSLLLCGQSFLKKFDGWSIDKTTSELKLKR